MPDKVVYFNVNNEQDLITLLGCGIPDEFRNLGYRPKGLLLAPQDDPELRAILDSHGIPLLHLDYRKTRLNRFLSGLFIKYRKAFFYGLSPFSSTLFAKSRCRYKNGEYNLLKFFGYKALSLPFLATAPLLPLLFRLYRAGIRGLDGIDGPAVSLDYIHNDIHLELAHANSKLGKPYCSYVANLDQITNYAVHLDVVDRIFVWGKFHEDVIVKRFRLPAAKVSRVGFCRSDGLAGASGPAADRIDAVYFCASEPGNDPYYDRNLAALAECLEASGKPYVLRLKKHPGCTAAFWDLHLRIVAAFALSRGKVEIVGSTWEKYNKIDNKSLAKKDFTYRDLKALLSSATHVFSSTSTTTLEAFIAGADAYFLNIDGGADACFRFEHLRILVEGGLIRMLRTKEELARSLSGRMPTGARPNPVVEFLGTASQRLATAVDAALFPGDTGQRESDIAVAQIKSN